MNKLWVRLTLAFGLVVAIAIVIAAVSANLYVSTQFRRFVQHDRLLNSTLTETLVEYYARNGSWNGVEAILSRQQPGGMGRGRGMQYGMPHLSLADATGRVIYDGSGSGQSTQLNRQQRLESVPLSLQGQTIGYLMMLGPSGSLQQTDPAQTFLQQINRFLLQAGLVAGLLGILLGLVIARGLSAPLSRLADAARRVSQGDLNQQVPVKGSDEVADLSRAFNDMAMSLEQAETLRRNMVADIAHELRTPLSVIQGNLQAILDDVYPLSKEEIAEIFGQSLVLTRLVNDLRELAQAEAGQLSLDIQPTPLGPLITGAVDLFQETAREREISLQADVPQELPQVLCDADRVRQILHNLLTNALQHTPPGGQVRLTVEQLIPSPPDTSSFVRVSVTDTGPGIPVQDLPHIFDRFWRADKSRSREHGGTGLGLAIARQLVEAQGGQIGVESDGLSGRGSRFWFTLPGQATN